MELTPSGRSKDFFSPTNKTSVYKSISKKFNLLTGNALSIRIFFGFDRRLP